VAHLSDGLHHCDGDTAISQAFLVFEHGGHLPIVRRHRDLLRWLLHTIDYQIPTSSLGENRLRLRDVVLVLWLPLHFRANDGSVLMGDTINAPRTHRHVWVLILAAVMYPIYSLCGLQSAFMLDFKEMIIFNCLVLPAAYFSLFFAIGYSKLRLKWIHFVWFTIVMLIWLGIQCYVLYIAFR
jgi:hypothetical protein